MTKEEFIKIASDFGFPDDVIEDLIELHDLYEISFDEIAIEEHLVD